jgi:hypothetical protein
MQTAPNGTSTRQLWKGIGNAKIFDRGNYVSGGFKGVVQVKRTIAKPTRGSGLAFIVEMQVVETNMPKEHPVGAKVTWFQKMVDLDIAFPAIKVWAAACVGLGVSQKDEIEEKLGGLDENGESVLELLMAHATDNEDNNDFIDILLGLETVQITTRNNKPFTRYDFSPVEQA